MTNLALPAQNHDVSVLMVEFGLTLIVFALAFMAPRLGWPVYRRVECWLARLARRQGLSVAVVGVAAFVLRLAILPVCPVPLPFIPDDFSFLLAAETFAAGRLTNPTPAMWMHFETIHETMVPTYQSMYFPAQGLVLAAGKVLTGQPWFGVLVVGALMWWMALGMGLLATTRPYEGMLLCLPVVVYLAYWIFKGKNVPSAAVLLRRAVGPVLLLLAMISWLGYYDHQAFGHATTLPYSVDRAEYAMAPYYVWQKARPEPDYRHAEMRKFYYVNEMGGFEKIHKLSGFVPETIFKLVRSFEFYAGFALLVPLMMMRRVFKDKRVRFLVICTLVLAGGMVIEIFLIPHYLAPFTAAFYAIGLQMMRHLRVWKPGGQPVGMTLVRLVVTLCVVMAAVRLDAGPLHFAGPEWPPSIWTDRWTGPGDFGTDRAGVAEKLAAMPGQQLVIVRYAGDHNPIDEWVYNAASIDGAKVVWAREMGSAENEDLIRYYKGRSVWLVEPDKKPVTVVPYAAAATAAGLGTAEAR
jgi:hypothetical protein